jgi:hypothetical protein
MVRGRKETGMSHCEDTIKAVMAHMRCGEQQAIDYLEASETQAEIDRITGYGPDDCDEYQEYRDAQLTEDK